MKRTILIAVAALLLLPLAPAQAQEIENREAAEKYNEGKALYEQGKYQEALELLLDSARLEPGNYRAHYMLGLTYNKLRQPDDAIAQLETAVRFNTNFYQAYYMLGIVYGNAKGNLEKAIEAYKNSTEISERLGSPYWQAWFNLGKIYFDQQNWDEAMEAYNKVAQINPTNEKAFNYMGRINIERREFEDALQYFMLASQRQPTWYEPYFHKASLLNRMGQHEQAITAADEAIQRQPNFGGSLYEKGVALRGLERWDEAIKVFEEAAKDAQWRESANHQIETIKNRDRYVIPPTPPPFG